MHRVVPTHSERGPSVLLSRIGADLLSVLREADVPAERLVAVGAAAPGIVDRIEGTVIAVNLEGWSRVPMAAMLNRALGAPVVVDNDVNMAILGERWRGSARGHDTCAFLLFGTGIGAGIVVNGQLHHGHHFLAGEIALMCMGPEYVDADFGGRGCLETLAGLKGLSSRWSHAGHRDTDGWVARLFEAASAGDRRARRIVHETATWIGMAIANVNVVLDPSLIVLGGGLILHGKSLLEDVRRIVGRIVRMPAQVVVSELGDEAPLWGSVLVATTEARDRLRQQLRGASTRSEIAMRLRARDRAEE
jgi:predicted NBD/HSP70 family sugar kinase